MEQPEVQPKQRGWPRRHKVLTIAAILFALFLIIGAAGGGRSTTGSSRAVKTGPPTTKAVATTPATLLQTSGSTTAMTSAFVTTSKWQLSYSYNCINTPTKSGAFIAQIFDRDGNLTSNMPVNVTGTGGSKTVDYTQSGTYTINVQSSCQWSLTVKG